MLSIALEAFEVIEFSPALPLSLFWCDRPYLALAALILVAICTAPETFVIRSRSVSLSLLQVILWIWTAKGFDSNQGMTNETFGLILRWLPAAGRRAPGHLLALVLALTTQTLLESSNSRWLVCWSVPYSCQRHWGHLGHHLTPLLSFWRPCLAWSFHHPLF